MGQYYHVAFNRIGKKKHTEYNARKVKGCDYIMAKLMEHSYFGNVLMDSVADILHNWETRLAWIGDYAEVDEVDKITKGEVSYLKSWGGVDDEGVEHEPTTTTELENVKFNYEGKYLVNLDKREYISFDDYMAKATDGWQLNPISILTAIGNGRGGGDFHSRNAKANAKVGSWAWDLITINDEKPKKMKKLNIVFKEG